MFESLKKKLLGFLGKEEEKTKKKSKKGSQKEKKSSKSKKKEVKSKKNKKVQVSEDFQEEPHSPNSKEEVNTPEPEKKKGFFSRFLENIGTEKLTQEQFSSLFAELELILLENNVALEAVDAIRAKLDQK